ncbi:hypothetical protein Q8W15_12875 [Photobacterium damselae subsp. piscicida]|uniref:Uncharacterized protein n=1 Tax=Photobacterium damsela subsp. piscicida TaxID=38294 RepID=A0A7L8A5T3_PHODP|nr:hypothetical protein [Photobacterium damselae]MBE8128858.1 hypothetical protein [Photobacterium damselae subsp. piscicida]MDP2532423.1 hypothetical protein [Photobacterium damselae subsp. piscicida]MDP2557941.1 hypothetical protein [Photobacterium damselae subsp. piscicida]MDP2569272.1 hypothetical protein [Photobacterium damselae subsp. piscicida]QOD53548.1 hypothetical protein IC628_05290 [Photobacterium damselae subsp. piscicida]
MPLPLLYLIGTSKNEQIGYQSHAVTFISALFWVVTPIDLLMVKFTFYKRSNNLIVHLFAFRKTNGFSY